MLKLNNIEMPSPKSEGVVITDEKVWSQNTKRTTSTIMVGDIKGIKKAIRIEFPPLSPAEEEIITSVVSNKNLPFFDFEFFDGVKTHKYEVYAGSPSRKLYSIVEGINYYTGYAVELVER